MKKNDLMSDNEKIIQDQKLIIESQKFLIKDYEYRLNLVWNLIKDIRKLLGVKYNQSVLDVISGKEERSDS